MNYWRNNMQLIMSVDRKECSTSINATSRAQLKRFLTQDGLSFELARGFYKGVEEQAFVINDPSPQQIQYLYAMARLYRQESVIYADRDFGMICHLDGEVMEIYRWIKAESTEGLAGYTETKDGIFTLVDYDV